MLPRKRFSALLLLLTSCVILIVLFFNTAQSNKRILGVWDVITPIMSPTVLPVMPTIKHDEAKIPVSEETYPVVKVVDGDTVAVKIGDTSETIRLIGINTPESVDPRKSVECFGKEASAKAHEILDGHSVRLVADPTQGERDKYNRLLRYVFRDDGIFFNKQMIDEGYAYEYTYATPYQYQSEFKNAQKKAKSLGLGLWSPTTCNGGDRDEYPSVDTTNFIDKDCKDFQSQAEAQKFFISLGGPSADPHKLDSNKDGTVCESLP